MSIEGEKVILLTNHNYGANIAINSMSLKHQTMKKYVCLICGYIYDPAEGDPESGIAPGTPFEEIPDDWTCPVCGVGKEDFEETK